MFPHTHVYFSTKLTTKKLHPYMVIGSMLPDSGFIGNNKAWGSLHQTEVAKEFVEDSKMKIPEHDELLTGIMNHIKLDYFSHVSYKDKIGFAYELQTPELRAIVAKALILTDEDAIKRKAHNFLETAVEHLLMKENADIQQLVKKSIQGVDMQKLSESLSDFFHTEKKQAHKGLQKFFALGTRYDVRDLQSCILYWEELNHYFFDHGIKKDKTYEALELSISIVEDIYKDFLAYSLKNYSNSEGVNGH